MASGSSEAVGMMLAGHRIKADLSIKQRRPF